VAGKAVLGRGLRALIPETPRARSGLAEIPVDHLMPSPNQPRKHFDPEALEELAESIKQHGVLQPLLVSEAADGRYRVIAGERRLRAAKLAGLRHVPAVIRERVQEEAQLALALVENLQRQDLTPLEEARAFEQLRVGLGLSQEEIAQRVGIDRSTVANAVRLLRLEPEIQLLVETGELSAGHARALLALSEGEQRMSWARRAAHSGMSVRELERAAATKRAQGKRPPRAVDPNLRDAEERLGFRLGTRVEIRRGRRGAHIVITCSDQQELQRVFELLMGDEDAARE